MNIEIIELDVVTLKAMIEGKTTIKAGTVIATHQIELEKAEAYFQRLFRLRSHKTLANVQRMPQSTFYNPTLSSEYGLNEEGLLVKGGEYIFQSFGRTLNTKKVAVPKKESK